MRAVFVVLFLCALVCAQTASFASEHSHQHSSQPLSHHCCGLCHVGPLPLLQPVSTSAFAPLLAVSWLAWSRDFDTPHEAQLTAGSSRAPPSALPV